MKILKIKAAMTALCMLLVYLPSILSCLYAREAVVFDYNTETGCYVFADNCEHLWEASGDYVIGDEYALIMWDKETAKIEDDIIIAAVPFARLNYNDYDNLYLTKS